MQKMTVSHSLNPAAAAAHTVMQSSIQASHCMKFIESLLREEMQQPSPDVAKLSIALGAVELPLTVKQEAAQFWPANIEEQFQLCLEALEAFVHQVHLRLLAEGTSEPRVSADAPEVPRSAARMPSGWSRLDAI